MIEVNRGQTYRFIWLSLVCDLFMQHRCSFIDIRTYLPDALTNIWIRKRRGDLALCSHLMTAVHSQTNSRHAESLGSSRFKRSTWSTRGIGKSKKQAGLIFDLWLRNVLSLVKQPTNQQWWRKIHCQGLLFVLFVLAFIWTRRCYLLQRTCSMVCLTEGLGLFVSKWLIISTNTRYCTIRST